MKRQRQPSDHSLWIGEEFGRFRNWVDFARGVTGSSAVAVFLGPLINQLIAVQGSSSARLTLILSAGIFVAAITIQMVRIEERLSLTPPIFFILGLAFGIVGPAACILAFVAIWAINLALPNPAIFLMAYAIIIVALGTSLDRGSLNTGLMAGLSVFPPLVAVMFRRRLARFKKRRKIVVR